MVQKEYEFGISHWRHRWSSILLRILCALLLIYFALSSIHSEEVSDRAAHVGIAIFFGILYANIEQHKQDVRIFFEQPVDLIGVPVLFITVGFSFYSFYLLFQ